MRHSHKMFIILCLSGTAFTLPAWAADDVPPAIQALLDSIERQSAVEPTYASIEADGDGTVTITKLAIAKPAEGDKPAINMQIEEAVLSDITDEGDGLYQIGSATFTNVSADMSGKDFAMTASLPAGAAEGWYVSALGDSPTPEEELRGSMTLANKMTAGKMTISAMGQTYSIDGYETTWDGDPKTGAGTFTMKVNNVAIPETAIAMIDQGGMLKQLGYAGLNFDLQSDGKIDIANGNMGLDFNFGLSGRDLAGLKLGVAASDIPMAVYAEMQKAQKSGKEPDFTALMPQIQTISFSGFTLRFEDASITKKLLPMLAAMQGMDEKTLIAQAGPMLQIGLMQLQNQAFAEKTAAAVNAFLNDPKSLTITAKPAAPVKVSDLMAMNPNAPGEAIGKLGVSVSSND